MLLSLVFSCYFLNAQKQVKLNSKPLFEYKSSKSTNISICFNISDIALVPDKDGFLEIKKDGLQKNYKQGNPDLPVLVRLLAFPASIKPVLSIQDYSTDTLTIGQLGFSQLIVPAIASISKSDQNQEQKPTKGAIYNIDEFNNTPIIEFIDRGIMRNIRIIELVYHPFCYNPVSNKIVIRNSLQAKLSWTDNSQIPESLNKINQTQDLGALVRESGITKSSDDSQSTYVIVAPLEFQSTLQPFVKWKKQQGFKIIEAYLGKEISVVSRNLIKSYLKELYLTPPANYNSPEYVLLVGDISELPTWSGVDGHATDLYYGEFTDDYLPECYVGRMSANSTDELEAILEKTLFVERGGSVDKRNYYNDHLLVSGVDGTYAPVYGNGAINYFLDYYSTPELGITPKYYLYGSGSVITSDNSLAKENILQDYNDGAGIVFYTAHCSSGGWANPSFNINDIASLSNTDKYPLMISNCCQSYMFNLNSFGENMVRAKNKGAVAYIGASDYTYWDEDYFWAVGLTSEIRANPTYEETGIGSWDAWFHTHNETTDAIASDVSQIVYAGNLAVQASSSDLKKYYWEIYGVSGDPSLVPAKFQYQTIHVDKINSLISGQESLAVSTIPNAKVTLLIDSTVYYSVANSLGVASLNFSPISVIGENKVEIVVSHPDYFPYIDTLSVLSPNRPYLVLNKICISDSLSNNNSQAESGEEFFIYFEIKNISSFDATNISVNLTSSSPWIESISENTNISIDRISANENTPIYNRCIIKLKNAIANKTEIVIDGKILYSDSLDYSFTYNINAMGPQLGFSYVSIDKNGIGNLNGILESSEIATLNVEFTNIGQMQVSNTIISFTSATDSLISISNFPSQLGGFDIQQSKSVDLQIIIADSIFAGTNTPINYTIFAGDSLQYQFKGSFDVLLGSMPAYNMENNTTNEIENALFYDSGGPNSNYNNKETIVTTFVPHIAGEGIHVDFNVFNIESGSNNCWDILEVYDGSDVSSTKLGAFCNYNYPSILMSQNENGALTFKFISDGSNTKPGWEAQISSSKTSKVTFIVLSNNSLISNATVNLVNQIQSTNETGKVSFSYVLNNFEKGYSISKSGYYTVADKIGSIQSDTIIYVELSTIPDVTFEVAFNGKPVKDANILLDAFTGITDSVGKVTFTDLSPGRKYFKISRTSFVDTSGYLYLNSTDLIETINLRCASVFSLEFNITDDISLLNSASVIINDETIQADGNGKIVVNNLYPDIYSYQIDCYGHYSDLGTVKIIDSNIVESVQLRRKLYSAMFNIKGNGLAIENALIVFNDTTIITTALGQAYLNRLFSTTPQSFSIIKDGFEIYNDEFTSQSDTTYNIDLIPIGIKERLEWAKIFPNPLNNNACLNIIAIYSPFLITITDDVGKVVFTKKSDSKNYTISPGSLGAGIYLINIQFKDKCYYEKVVVY